MRPQEYTSKTYVCSLKHLSESLLLILLDIEATFNLIFCVSYLSNELLTFIFTVNSHEFMYSKSPFLFQIDSSSLSPLFQLHNLVIAILLEPNKPSYQNEPLQNLIHKVNHTKAKLKISAFARKEILSLVHEVIKTPVQCGA